MFEGIVLRVIKAQIQCGYVDQSGFWMIGHRVPVVPAQRPRLHPFAVVGVIARWALYRPAGFGVHVGGPVHWHISFGRNEVPVCSVQHVEKAVFRRLHDDLSRLVVNFDISQNHMLGCGVVPGVPGCGLIMPDVFAGIGVQGDDRRKI